MNKDFKKLSVTLGLIVGLMPLGPILAGASEEGHRNTAIGLGALSGVLLLTQKNKLPGIAAAAGAGVSYYNYDKSIRQRHRREAARRQARARQARARQARARQARSHHARHVTRR